MARAALGVVFGGLCFGREKKCAMVTVVKISIVYSSFLDFYYTNVLRVVSA